MKQWQQRIAVILLLTLPFLIFISSNKAPANHNFGDRVILTAILPLQLTFESIFDCLSDLWSGYLDLRHTHQENNLLRVKLDQQQTRTLLLNEVIKENNRLRALLNYTTIPGFTHVGAQVIAAGPSPYFHVIQIDRGENDGVTLGAAVIVPTGIVGRVVALTKHSAEIALITDPNSSIDVLLAKSRSRGRVVGLGDDSSFKTTLNYILRTDQVALGDWVITSGLDGLFPKGLPVGQVVEIRKHHYGLHQELILDAAADLTHLEEVLVLIPTTNNDGSTES